MLSESYVIGSELNFRLRNYRKKIMNNELDRITIREYIFHKKLDRKQLFCLYFVYFNQATF